MSTYRYEKETIHNILQLLQELEIKGFKNAGLLFSASEMLRNPLEEVEEHDKVGA
ncbi:hypothetical protein [Acetivibrio ethanolgignens]|uniref:hypothetical protein n=1 Tax=Acetivibrio ethanolgignens TaxID=290052 RepID=UPI0012DFABAD|nr:hypothetical protein [Acetivibrio ethanolgignens]